MNIGRIMGAKVIVRGIAVAACFTGCDGILEPCLNSKSLLFLPPVRFLVLKGVAPFPRLVLGVA